MPSTSPGTSVKKPDPNIKSMYPVSVEGGLVLGLSPAGRSSMARFERWRFRAVGLFSSPRKVAFQSPLRGRGLGVGGDQGLLLPLLDLVALTPVFV